LSTVVDTADGHGAEAVVATDGMVVDGRSLLLVENQVGGGQA
jgi:hypothetical protein